MKKVNTLLPLKPRCRPSKGKKAEEVSFFYIFFLEKTLKELKRLELFFL